MMMEFIAWLCELSGMSLDEFCIWLCLLVFIQAVMVTALIRHEIRRPSPVEDLMRDRHFGGV